MKLTTTPEKYTEACREKWYCHTILNAGEGELVWRKCVRSMHGLMTIYEAAEQFAYETLERLGGNIEDGETTWVAVEVSDEEYVRYRVTASTRVTMNATLEQRGER